MDTEHNDLLVRINKCYKSMSKGQRLLANYIIENYDRAAFITASKLGRTVGVSESTVVRFAYALGFDGYPELQKSLQEVIRNKLTSVQRIKLTSDLDENDVLRSVIKADMANLRATLEAADNSVFNAAVDSVVSARKVYIIGLKSAAPLAQFLAYYLSFILDNVVLVSLAITDIHESMIQICEGDICIGISFPRYSSRTLEALKFAKSRGARIVAITDGMFSPIAGLADYCLSARSDMASFADSLAAPLSMINAIIVAASIRNKEKVSERLAQLERIWDKQNVYIKKESDINR